MIEILEVNTNILIMTLAVLMGVLMSLLHYDSVCFQDKGMIIMISYVFAGLSATYAYQAENIYLMLYGILSISYACLVKETDTERNTTAALLTLLVIMMCLVVTSDLGKILLLPCILFTFSALTVRMKSIYARPRISPPPPRHV